MRGSWVGRRWRSGGGDRAGRCLARSVRERRRWREAREMPGDRAEERYGIEQIGSGSAWSGGAGKESREREIGWEKIDQKKVVG